MDGTWVAPPKKIKYSTNPNGNDWADDTSGFGRRMLERLGWSPGTGLGKNRNGILTSLKPKGQMSTAGLGKKIDYSFIGTQQLDDYAKLLKSLNESYNSLRKPDSSSSLEELSKSSKKRLHYSKLVRAKDASTYDNRSLAVILGEPAKLAEEPMKTSGSELAGLNDFGVPTTKSAISSTDYFKQRSLSKRKKDMNTLKSTESVEKQKDIPDIPSSVETGSKIGVNIPPQGHSGSPEHASPPIDGSEGSLACSGTGSSSGEMNTIPESCVFRTTNLLSLSGYVHY